MGPPRAAGPAGGLSRPPQRRRYPTITVVAVGRGIGTAAVLLPAAAAAGLKATADVTLPCKAAPVLCDDGGGGGGGGAEAEALLAAAGHLAQDDGVDVALALGERGGCGEGVGGGGCDGAVGSALL